MARRLTASGAALIVALALVARRLRRYRPAVVGDHDDRDDLDGHDPGGRLRRPPFQACLASTASSSRPASATGSRRRAVRRPAAEAASAGWRPPPSFSAQAAESVRGLPEQAARPVRDAGGGFPGGGQSNPALTKYTSCLRQHGVTFGGSNNQSAFKKASAACAKYAPTAGG